MRVWEAGGERSLINEKNDELPSLIARPEDPADPHGVRMRTYVCACMCVRERARACVEVFRGLFATRRAGGTRVGDPPRHLARTYTHAYIHIHTYAHTRRVTREFCRLRDDNARARRHDGSRVI